ncbi:MAG: DUF11 domain-containing protein [Planctomycetales bacterium]|nr:DUF11 domain-containing protein [Planctomycetales bacterium]
MKAIGQGDFAGRTRTSSGTHQVVCLVVTLFFLFLPACARLSLPAIDPTGQRIFLPFPNSTYLSLPPLHSRGAEPGFLPQNAFPQPITPPPCVDATPGGMCNLFNHKPLGQCIQDHFDKYNPGKAGELQLTPKLVVAPVGGEVVLLAGVCGTDGYYVTRQPLEWMLSPDSVGQFIEVGDDMRGKLVSTLSHAAKVEKLDVDFAKGRTSNKATLITRGSPGCDDDIQLREGQTWISVSSPSEGISRITALAPESEIWDRRRETATIYWVDAQWDFPDPPTPTRSGTPVELVTRVNKAENLVPAEGWKVRYTILDPTVASFRPSPGSSPGPIENSLDVIVDRDGIAATTIVAAQTADGGMARGTSPVLVEVIRPAQPTDRLPELTLGRGQTFVTFSAPALALQAFGPNEATSGQQLTYVASLQNPGDIDAENVSMAVMVPAGTRVVSTIPEAKTYVQGSGVIWEQGILPAGRQLDVSVVLEPLRTDFTFEVQFLAEGTPNLGSRASVQTRVQDPQIDVEFAPKDGIAEAEVGRTVEYDIRVTNKGRQTVTDLQLTIVTDPGLPEMYEAANRVDQEISMIQPGQTISLPIVFRVQQQGQLSAHLTVKTSDGQHTLAEKKSSVQGLPPREKQPGARIDIAFPASIQVGQPGIRGSFTLRNTGETGLSNIEVMITVDPSLVPTKVDPGNERRFRPSPDGRTWLWTPGDLLARATSQSGDTYTSMILEFNAVASTATASISARVRTAEGAITEDTADFRVLDGSAILPGTPPTSPAAPPATRTGQLSIDVNEITGDPVRVNEELRYYLHVVNEQNLPDNNVRVRITLPQGVDFIGATLAGTPVQVVFGDNGTVEFETVRSVRTGERLSYVFVVRPRVPQSMILTAEAKSDNQPSPVKDSEPTDVLPAIQ